MRPQAAAKAAVVETKLAMATPEIVVAHGAMATNVRTPVKFVRAVAHGRPLAARRPFNP